MPSPWRRFHFAFSARMVALLLLLVALAYPARQPAVKDGGIRVLAEQSKSEEYSATRERIIEEIGETSSLSIGSAVKDIDEALREALWATDPLTPGAIIIASEGRWSQNMLTTLLHARAAGVKVFWLPNRPVELVPAIWNISTPSIARSGQRIGISVDVELADSQEAEVVLLSNQRPVERKKIVASGKVSFVSDVPGNGPLVFGAELRDANTGTVIASLPQGSLTNVSSSPSILVVSNGDSVLGESLREGGWSVSELRPEELVGELDTLPSFAGLILDDIAAGDLSTSAWARIDKAVRQDAMGMLVLGGPHSYGLGGYRDSQLESLLPVISEPPGNEAPASLVFLIDVSGSMDRQDGVSNRLRLAQQATIETAHALRPVDRVGLMSFDVQTRELLAIDSRADHARSIERIWPESASGGTQLMAPLRRAIDALDEEEAEQKILVLLTDGFVPGEDLNQLSAALGDTDVELIAMIVGDSQAPEVSALSAITEANRGRTISVDDALRLPMLMRSEVESRRPAVMIGPSMPKPVSPATWMPGDVSWPYVDAYLLTRARPEAQVHLSSERGDVILASVSAGAGKVVAVTSGFGSWTKEWMDWNGWPRFATGLTAFVAARDTGQSRIFVLQDHRGGARLRVELADRQFANDVRANMVSPSGAISSIDLHPRSPGELTADLELIGEGQFTVVLDNGDSTTRHRFLKRSNYDAPRNELPVARAWVNDGVLALWDPANLPSRESNDGTRFLLAGLSLLVFFASLVLERASPVWNHLLSNLRR